jgi:hypothetical protein
MDVLAIFIFAVVCFILFPCGVILLSMLIDTIEQKIKSRKEQENDEKMD